jgi:threonine/homoserine/homoserine lactone efflux protein
MPELSELPLFFLAAVVSLLTPGPAALHIVARSVDQGRRAGLVSALSIEVGNSMRVTAASALAFSVVICLGAAYRIFLGVRKLLVSEAPLSTTPVAPQSARRIFYQGVVVATLNPKTALFFLAFLPRFADSSRGAIAPQMLALGGLFVWMAIVSDSLYAFTASSRGGWLKSNRAFWRAERHLVGSVYVGLGLTAALSGNAQY